MLKIIKRLKLIDRITLIISIFAITISVLGIYFQFFNKRHKVLYATLEPSFNGTHQTISIPILFKNLGNQTEVILDSELKLETKDDSSSFFRNLPLQTQSSFPLILSPNESKLIELTGSYKEYLFGSFSVSEENELIYNPLSILDSLKLVADIKYITTSGEVGNQEKEVGYMSFNDKKKFERIDCSPIKLKRLPIRSADFHIIYYSKLAQTNNVNLRIDPNDPKINEKLLLLEQMIKDSSLMVRQ